jgi:hypothetical protein
MEAQSARISFIASVVEMEEDADNATDEVTTIQTIPEANAHFCFWKVELFNSEGVAQTFYHYFDANPEQTLDRLCAEPYNTPGYYPPNYASVYGYAFAEDKALNLTVETTDYSATSDDDVATATFGKNQMLQTVKYTNENNETPDSIWGQIYVARSKTGDGYVSASIRDSYNETEAKRFYFKHCVTRIKLLLRRSAKMTGDATVKNVRIYTLNRCHPTHLMMDLEQGYRAVYIDPADVEAGKESTAYEYPTTPTTQYLGQLTTTTFISTESPLYLLLEDYTPDITVPKEADYEANPLPLRITAYYGDELKEFNIKLQAAEKEGFYRLNESYTVRITFDTDMLTLESNLSDWENGATSILVYEKDAEVIETEGGDGDGDGDDKNDGNSENGGENGNEENEENEGNEGNENSENGTNSGTDE